MNFSQFLKYMFSSDKDLPRHPKDSYKFLSLFLTLYLVTVLTTQVLALRVTTVFGHILPGGIFIFPLTFVINDIVGEVYGYSEPKKFIWLGFFAEIIFSIVTIAVAHAHYPAEFKYTQSYQTVLDPTFRYAWSSFAGILVGEFLNIYVLSKLKVFFRGRHFVARFIVSNAIGQLFLSLIVDTLIFYGKVSVVDFVSMALNGYLWKMMIALIFSFPAWVLINKLKQVERVDVYDYDVNYNPFSFSSRKTDLNDNSSMAKQEH